MSHNVSEETRRSPRTIRRSHNKSAAEPQHPKDRAPPSPRSIQHHPSLTMMMTPPPPQLCRAAPTDTLYRLLLHPNRDWQGAQERLRCHPRDAAYKQLLAPHGGSDTPLHAACRRRAPPALLMALTQAWPVALWTPDGAGWLPLHALLVHSGGGESSSSEEAVCAVIRAGGRAAASFVGSEGDNDNNLVVTTGGTALHLACRHGASLRVLAELLRQYPDAVRRHGVPCFPADLVWRQRERARRWRTTTTTHNEEDEEDAASRRAELVLLQQRWYLLMAAAQGRPMTTTTAGNEEDDRWQRLLRVGDAGDDPLFTLHEVLDFHYTCTTPAAAAPTNSFSSNPSHTNNTTTTTTNHDNFVSVYLRFHPHAAAAVDAHHRHDGAAGRGWRLPLHVACAHWSSSRWSDHDTALRTVLQAHPPAAAMRDDQGRLPLHVALSKANNHTIHPRNRHHQNNRVLNQLVAAYPAALERRCPATGLFPFQMAAAACSQEVPPRDDDDGLNAIFDLLRACPQAAIVGQRRP